MAQAQPKKVNWWYHAIIEWQLENPHLKLEDCARELHVSQPWLSCIINSDAFQELWQARRGEHFSAVSSSIIERTQGLATIAVDALSDRIADERETLPVSTIRETADMALKALGFAPAHGNRASVHNQTNNFNLGTTDAATLAAAREKMRLVNADNSVPHLEAPADDNRPQLIEVPAADKV